MIPELALAGAVVLGFAGGTILGLVVAGHRLAEPVRFLEDLLGLLEQERRRLEALLSELEVDEQERRPPASN